MRAQFSLSLIHQREERNRIMTITYVSKIVAEIKKALAENNLSKVNDYANNGGFRDCIYLIINDHFMIDKLAQIDNDTSAIV